MTVFAVVGHAARILLMVRVDALSMAWTLSQSHPGITPSLVHAILDVRAQLSLSGMRVDS